MAVSSGAGLCRKHEKCDGEGAGGAENRRVHRRVEKIHSVRKPWALIFHTAIHDNRMIAERAFYYYGIYPVEGIGVFRVPKNGDARNKKPPALRVETKRCTKKSPFRYNRVVQALL